MSAGRIWTARFLIGFAVITAIGYVTYFRNYDNPPALFWDENYHIASAQKYLNGVFFMEPHPPLGKLLIALGERLVGANKSSEFFVETDYIKSVPPGFSFAGFRFFPALFAWLGAGVFYLFFVEVTSSPAAAFFFTLPYLFDNAIIAHCRGAMLEGPQLFFVLTSLLFLVRLMKGQSSTADSIMLGLSIGCALSIKINSVVPAALPIAAVSVLRRFDARMRRHLILCYAVAGAVFLSVWRIHLDLGKRVIPSLPNGGSYGASEAIMNDLRGGRSPDLFAGIGENISFASRYTAGVPKLDTSKPGENGSSPVFWPIGGMSILYRWEGNDTAVRYLYLQCNPAGWWLALAGILLTTVRGIRGLFHRGARIPAEAAVLVTGYWSYLGWVLTVDRVLYLYHYFIPLVFGYALLPYAVHITGKSAAGAVRSMTAAIVAASIVMSYLFFRPFTAYEPLTPAEVGRRAWLPVWRITCVRCGEEAAAASSSKS